MLNTLGVAQYRVGAFEDALATLTRSDQLNRQPSAPHNQARSGAAASQPAVDADTGVPTDVAFIAMSLHQLGRKDEARVALERLRKLMQQPQWSGNEESQGFLREAEALIGGSDGPVQRPQDR